MIPFEHRSWSAIIACSFESKNISPKVAFSVFNSLLQFDCCKSMIFRVLNSSKRALGLSNSPKFILFDSIHWWVEEKFYLYLKFLKCIKQININKIACMKIVILALRGLNFEKSNWFAQLIKNMISDESWTSGKTRPEPFVLTNCYIWFHLLGFTLAFFKTIWSHRTLECKTLLGASIGKTSSSFKSTKMQRVFLSR